MLRRLTPASTLVISKTLIPANGSVADSAAPTGVASHLLWKFCGMRTYCCASRRLRGRNVLVSDIDADRAELAYALLHDHARNTEIRLQRQSKGIEILRKRSEIQSPRLLRPRNRNLEALTSCNPLSFSSSYVLDYNVHRHR